MPSDLGHFPESKVSDYFFAGGVSTRAPTFMGAMTQGLQRLIQAVGSRCWYCGCILLTDAACCPHCGGPRKDKP